MSFHFASFHLLPESNIDLFKLIFYRLCNALISSADAIPPPATAAKRAPGSCTVVFATGCGLTGYHTKSVQALLEQAGYRFQHVQSAIRGNGATKLPADDKNAIYEAISTETGAGREVVLVLHSDAATPGLRALSKYCSNSTNHSRERSSVTRTIFIAAQMDDFEQYPTAPSCANNLSSFDNPADTLFSDLAPYDAQPFVNALQPQHSTTAADDDASVSQLWKLVPSTYIACTRDRALSPEYQTGVSARFEMDLVELAADHCPMVSRPRELVEAVIRAID